MCKPLLLAFCLSLPLLAVAHEPGAEIGPDSWVQRDEFEGQKILMVTYYNFPMNEEPLRYVPHVLHEAGFQVDTYIVPETLPDLSGYDQFWIFSASRDRYDHFKPTPVKGRFNWKDVRAVRKFVRDGGALYVLADNTPMTREANMIGKSLHGVRLKGEYLGGKVVPVTGDPALKHEVFTGYDTIFEGITVCHISPSRALDVILRASDERPLVAVSRRPGEKVIYDCGYTRAMYGFTSEPKTSAAWFRNVAAYLAGKRHEQSM